MQKRKCFSLRLSEKEKEEIVRISTSVGLSSSAYIRQLALGYEPASIFDHETILRFCKAHGDLGRMGGLLKLWLTNDEKIFNGKDQVDEIFTLLKNISQTQSILYQIVLEIREQLKSGSAEYDS